MFDAVVATHGHVAVCWLDQSGNYLGERCLSGTVASDQTEDLARFDFKRDVAQSFNRILRRAPKEFTQPQERDGISFRQAADRNRGHRARCRGSRYSRRPSPMKLKASTVSAIAMPGKIKACGATANVERSRASSIITPQDGAGGGTPSPRNDNDASESTAPAMPRLACTITGWIAFGRM